MTHPIHLSWRPLNATTVSAKSSSQWGGVICSTSISPTSTAAPCGKVATGATVVPILYGQALDAAVGLRRAATRKRPPQIDRKPVDKVADSI